MLGGRLGYVLFYQPAHYFAHPAPDLRGLAGRHVLPRRRARRDRRDHAVLLAQHAFPLLGFADRIAVCVPIGLGLGRIANFINGELWGRPAPDWLPWAMIFPAAPARCRAIPSQIYQALLEGLVLFLRDARACPAGSACGRGSAC